MKKTTAKSKKKNQLQISKKIKFLKARKSLSNIDNVLKFRKTRVCYGNFAIQAKKSGIMARNQLEAVRIYLKKSVKRVANSKIYVLVKPTRLVTKRSQETRMGRGKGSIKAQIALVCRGQLIYEIVCSESKPVNEAFEKIKTKLSVPVSLVKC